MTAPTIYHLDNPAHAARFNITAAEAATILSYRFTNRRDGSRQGRPTAMFWHIHDGSTIGGLDYWANYHAASSSYSIQRDGSILVIIGESHGPWTNGAVRNPTAAWQAFAKHYPGNPNIWTISCEMEATRSAPPNEVQLESAAWLYADVASRWGRITQFGHRDVDQVERAFCPGDAFLTKIKARTASGAPNPSPSRLYGTITRFPAPVLVTVTTSGLNVRQWGDLDSPILATDPQGSRFWASAVVIGDSVDHEDRWYIEAGTKGLRRWAGGTDQAGL